MSNDEPHFHGHRDRLRQRFVEAGESLPDYELLELVLFRSIPRRDVKALAKALIAQFGSFAEVLGAPLERLKGVDGIGMATALDIKIVAAAAGRQARGAVRELVTVSSWSALLEYCRVTMAFAEREELRVLYLDKKNKVLANEINQIGTIDHTPLYPREILKRAIELSATALILVHNHPSGDPKPSKADLAMTAELVRIAEPLGIAIHDHVIIGRNGHTSFKGSGLL